MIRQSLNPPLPVKTYGKRFFDANAKNGYTLKDVLH